MDAAQRKRLRPSTVFWALYALAGLAVDWFFVRPQGVEAKGVENLLSHAALASVILVLLAMPPALWLLARRHARSIDLRIPIPRSKRLSAPAAFLALCLAIGGGGFALFILGRSLEIENTTESLSDVANLKRRLLVHWYGESVGDLAGWMSHPDLTARLEAWRSAGYADGPPRQRLMDYLQLLARNEHLAKIGLRDAETGAVLLPAGGSADDDALKVLSLAAVRAKRPVLESTHRTPGETGGPYVGFLVPIAPAESPEVRAVAYVGIDAEHSLFPLLESEERAASSETLLLSKDKAGWLVLFEGGRNLHSTRERRVLQTQGHYLAAAAASPDGATLFGRDERGRPVIAYATPVPGTPWTVVAKVDQSEALVDLHTLAMFSAALAGVLALMGAWWWVEEQGHLSRLMQSRLERARLSHRVDFLAKQANDSVFVCDPQGRVIDLNERAITTYGQAREALMTASGADGPVAELREIVQRLNGGNSLLFESVHRRHDGSEMPVEVAALRIDIDGRECIQVVIRDISERVATARHIVELSRLHATISAVNQAIVRGQDLESVFRSVCWACVEHGRFRLAWVGIVDERGRFSRPISSAGEGTAFVEFAADWVETVAKAEDPTSIARREGRTSVCADIARGPADPTWRHRAAAQGFASAIALPMRHAERTIGVLSVYASQGQVFDGDSVRLLQEMTENLEFAVAHFEQERNRQIAERARARTAKHLAEVSRRVVQVQEDERKRLATELHDTAGTSMVAVQFSLAMAERTLQANQPGPRDLLRRSIAMLTKIIGNVRDVCSELRPPILDHAGLASALEASAQTFNQLGTAQVRFSHDAGLPRLTVEIETTLYRIAQEAITNGAKHAQASTINVHLGTRHGRVQLTIDDDGKGFDMASLASAGRSPGQGLLTMRERAEFMGGSLVVSSSPAAGTHVEVELPLIEAQTRDATAPSN